MKPKCHTGACRKWRPWHVQALGWIVCGVFLFVAESAWAAPPRITSLDLIEGAARTGRITRSQELEHKAALWFNQQDVPREYWVETATGLRPVAPLWATPMLLELQVNQRSLPGQYASQFGSLRAQGQAPEYRTERTYQFGQFLVHWSEDPEDGANRLAQYDVNPANGVADDINGNGVPDYVEDLARWYQFSWETQVWHPLFFFKDVLRDGSAGGGNNLMDIYVMDLPYGVMGVTFLETGQPYFGMPVRPMDFSTLVNDEYDSVYGYVKGNMKVTAAHELFHGIQNSYGLMNEANFGLFIIEGTAMWMMDAVYDNVNGDAGWLGYLFKEPDTPLLATSYHSLPYWIFMAERFGTDGFGIPAYQGEDKDPDPRIDPRGADFIRALWEQTEEPNMGGWWTVNALLETRYQSDFDTSFSEFTLAVASKELGNTTWNDFNEDDERQEPFTDINWNGTWDPGEPFTDLNGNGKWDSGYPSVAYQQQLVLSGNENMDLGVDSVSEMAADYYHFDVGGRVATLTLHLDGEDGIQGKDWPVFTGTLLLIQQRTLKTMYSFSLPQPHHSLTVSRDVTSCDEVILILRSLWVGGTYSIGLETTPAPPTTAKDGWMRVSNNSSQPMVGMELFGLSDGSMAGVMGIINAGTTGYLPHYKVTPEWWTGVAFANPTTSENTITLNAYGNAGGWMGGTTLTIPPMGRLTRLVSDLFAPTKTGLGSEIRSVDNPTEGWIHYAASGPLAAMEIYGNKKSGGLSALPGALPGTELYLPHFQVNDSWWTGASILNVDVTDPNPNLVTLMAYDNNGNFIPPLKTHALAPGQKLTGMVNDPAFLGVSGTQASNGGWIKITAERPVVAMEAYGLKGKMGNAAMNAAPKGTLLYIPRLVNNSAQRTGIAVINTSDNAATVTLTPYNKAGIALGGVSTVLAPRQKLSQWADLMFSGLANPVEGYVRVVSTQPLAGMEIIINRNTPGFAAETAMVAPGTPVIFPQFAFGGTWWTQYSFTNAGIISTQTNIDLYDALGKRLLSQSFELNGNCTVTGFVSQLLN